MTMEEDRPVCEVVTQTKCDDQTPSPGEIQGGLEGGKTISVTKRIWFE